MCRSTLAGGATALALADGAATAGGTSPASPGVVLTVPSTGLDATHRGIDALFAADWDSTSVGGPKAADAAAYRIGWRQRRLLDRIYALQPPAGLGGCAALARSPAPLCLGLMHAAPDADAGLDGRLTVMLVRGLAREAA